MIMRHCLKALGEDTICVIHASCWSIIAGNWPYSSLKVPVLHTAFETAAAVLPESVLLWKSKGVKTPRCLLLQEMEELLTLDFSHFPVQRNAMKKSFMSVMTMKPT